MSLSTQIVWLFILAIPIACVAWTFTHEEAFREFHEYFVQKSENASSLLARKFFYLLTCEYCLSHYVTAFFLIISGYKLLLPGIRGYLVAFFALVWVANLYMTLYGHFRVEMKIERVESKKVEHEAKKVEHEAKKVEEELKQLQPDSQNDRSAA